MTTWLLKKWSKISRRSTRCILPTDTIALPPPAGYELHGTQNDARSSRHHEEGFLCVIFPHDELQILPYNRVVRDLNGHTPRTFLQALALDYELQPATQPGQAPEAGFDMYLEGRWHRAFPKWTPEQRSGIEQDPVHALAVSVLTDRVFDSTAGTLRINARIRGSISSEASSRRKPWPRRWMGESGTSRSGCTPRPLTNSWRCPMPEAVSCRPRARGLNPSCVTVYSCICSGTCERLPSYLSSSSG